MPTGHKPGYRVIVLTTLLALGVFLADLFLPSGAASGVSYVAVVLLTLWSLHRWFTLTLAVGCTALLILGGVITSPDGMLWQSLASRATALLALWIAAILLYQHKRTEATLRDSEARYRAVVDSSIQGLYIQQDGLIRFANPAMARIFGYAASSELLGKSFRILIEPHHVARMETYLATQLHDDTVLSPLDFQGKRRDGSLIWLECLASHTTWDNKPAILATFLDITERKHAEESLAGRAKQMETVRTVSSEITRELDLTTLLHLIIRRAVELVESAGAGVVLLWDDEAQVLVSRAWCGLGIWIQGVRLALGEGITGLVAQRRKGLLVNDYQNSKHAAQHLISHIGPTAVLAEPLLYRDQLLGVITLGNEGTRLRFSEPDRELLSLFAAQAATAIENARLFKEVQDQADQLTRTNSALRDSEERYRAFVAQSSEGIWRFEFESPMPICLPEDEQIEYFYQHSYLAECNDVMARMYGFTSAQELVGVRLDQLLIRSEPDNITLQRNFIRSGYRLVGAISHETDIRGRPKVFLNNFVGIIEDGHLLRTWGSQQDITERKHLEKRLLQTQKMAAIGTLAGGIAHDFNNILAAILGYTELALSDDSADSRTSHHLHEVLTAGKRAKDLVQQILTFSRQTENRRQPVRLHQLIREALTMIRASLPTTIEIKQQLDPEVASIMADPTQIHQVLMNLCTNAAHAMRESGGTLEVVLESVEVGPDTAAMFPTLLPGTYARLAIRDTGIGMSAEVRERIFEPFFTTKQVGEGTGMGLAVVHGIVSNHNGTITVKSAPQQGATFTVYLPGLPDHDETVLKRDRPVHEGHGHILFVDDEESPARPILDSWR